MVTSPDEALWCPECERKMSAEAEDDYMDALVSAGHMQ